MYKRQVFVVKRFHRPEWGQDWRKHYSVDVVNGRQGYSLKLDGRKLIVNTLRIGFAKDGSWRVFGLRHDFHPAIKVQTEDDITASVVVPAGAVSGQAGGLSQKYALNCERYLFQRPDDAIHRGYDGQAEADIAPVSYTHLDVYKRQHNDSAGDLTYTLSAGLFANERKTTSQNTTEVTDAANGALLEDRDTANSSLGRNVGLNLGGRLQWRLGEGGDALTLMPGMHLSRNRNRYEFDTTEALRRPITPELADRGSGGNESSFVGPRLMLQYRQRVSGWRLEGGGTVRASRWVNDSTRDERRSDGSLLRSQEDHTVSREKGWQLNAKGSRLLGGEGSEHSLVAVCLLYTSRCV